MVKLGEQVGGSQSFNESDLSRTQRKILTLQRSQDARRRQDLVNKETNRREKILAQKVAESKGLSLDEYKKFYSTLNEGWLRSSFTSPTTIEANNQSQVQDNLNFADKEKAVYQDKIDRKNITLEQIKQRWDNRSSSYRNNDRNRARYDRELQKSEDKIAEYKLYINTWDNAKERYLGKLGTNVDNVKTVGELDR